MRLVLLLAATVLLLRALDRLALWAERRGWIYYRTRRRSPGALGNALLEVHSLFEPGLEATVEVRSEEAAEQAAPADPPEAGGPERSA